MLEKLTELWRFRELIYTFVARDLKARYRGTVLGFLWSFLDPLLNMAVLWVIFGHFFSRGIENFPIFLLIGILPWNFFASSVSQGSQAVVGNAGLIKKIYFPREIFPLAMVLANLIHFFFALAVLGVILPFMAVKISFTGLLLFPAILILSMFFNYGAALFTSALSVYFRDFPFIIESLLRVWYFATPIFYSLEMIPEKFRSLYLLNPLAAIVTAYRQILMEGKIPGLELWGLLTLMALLGLVVGWFVFEKLQRGFAEEI